MNPILGTLVVLIALPGQRRAPFLPRPRLDALRDARIRRIVGYAARTVPHYRELFARERIDPRDIRGADDLARLPLLDPDAVRREPARFLSESRRAHGAPVFLTSGSTGRPLEVYHDQRSLLANIAFGERERAPMIALCGTGFRPNEVYIGYDTSNFRKVLAFYAANTRMPVKPRRTTVSMMQPLDDIVAAIDTVKPDLLTAYGGFLDVLYRTLVARDAPIHRPKVVMYMGEALPADRRAWIEETLGARVLSRYCATEAFKIGYFCEARTGFHVHEDLCHVRLRPTSGSADEQTGEVVISNLVNYATVLLNYPMGDVATWSQAPCPCGRTFRLMSEVHGRVEDVLRLSDGTTLHPRAVWHTLKDDRSLLQYQLIQHAPERFELKLATLDEAAFPAARERAERALRPLLGPGATIETAWRADLGRSERERTGKFRAVESRVR